MQEAKAFKTMTDGMKYFLGAVGVVTLSLGGLGVMNVMLVAVRERTREIGVRKALGAPAGSILKQFFLEALLIALISGGTGLVIAFGMCALVNMIPMPDFFAGLLPTWQTGAIAVLLLGMIVARTDVAEQDLAQVTEATRTLATDLEARLRMRDRIAAVAAAVIDAAPKAGLRPVPGSLARDGDRVVFRTQRTDDESALAVEIGPAAHGEVQIVYRGSSPDFTTVLASEGEEKHCDLTEKVLAHPPRRAPRRRAARRAPSCRGPRSARSRPPRGARSGRPARPVIGEATMPTSCP